MTQDTTVTVGGGAFALSLRLPPTGMPDIVACGGPPVTENPLADIERSSRVNGMDAAVPAAVLLPVGGLGFFGWPAIAGHRNGRDFLLELSGWRIDRAGSRTTLTARDPVARIALSIVLESFPSGVIAMASRLTNEGDAPYTLDRCASATFLAPAGEAEVISFTGMWGREFQTRRDRLGEGMWVRENRRGRTSHDRVPMIMIAGSGQRFALALGWSGNHQIVIDRIDDGRRLIHLGALFEPGEMILPPGARYDSPVAYAGPDSAAFHAFVRDSLIPWPGGRATPRPVTLNTWEGNYFDHRLDSLKAQATAAAALGIERFVLDDGWFGQRDDDTTSLGDWDVDPRKYPAGLGPLIDHVTGLGLQFGLWLEPEMVNPESRLYRSHPDWALRVDGYAPRPSRSQLVLDLTRPEVADHLFHKIDAILANHAVSSVKWDMNRDLTHVGGRHGTARTTAQTRALYALIDRVRAAHPTVEIESCASGGGRIDCGVLARTHRVWTSDCTDALERLEIQRGASAFLPPEILGSHVSASPNHQTGRRHTLAFRALIAMAYHMGVELNPLTLTPAEAAELAGWIAHHKRLRPLLHAPGAAFHLDPVDGRYAWGAAGADRIVLFVAQGPQMIAEQPLPLTLPPQVAGRGGRWRISAVHPADPAFVRLSDGQRRLLSGAIAFNLATLDRSGLPLPMLRPESAILLELEPIVRDTANG